MALEFLASQGFHLLVQNYRCGHAEIDLVVQNGDLLVFVEVKYRSPSEYGPPEAAVSRHQQACIMQAAEQFIWEKNWAGDIRFDIVAISPGASPEIVHFEDVFY
ncbi:MAG: YraN family protein [Microscillaceae bacterium]|nr:YraN family protein [Microscillaceae bacterium]